MVVFHAHQFSGTQGGRFISALDAAVAWFFVLSALVLFLPVARSVLTGEGRQTTRGFLVRRAIRILPLYFVAILVVWALRNPSLPGDWRDLVEHLTFTHVYDSKRIFYTIGPAWSLAIEVHFYVLVVLLAPPLFHLAQRMRTHAKRVALLAAFPVALVVVSIAFRLFADGPWKVPEDRWSVWFSFPARLDNFAIGMLLAVAYTATADRRRALGAVPAVALRIASVGVLASAVALEVRHHLWLHLAASVAAALMFASSIFGPRESLWARALSTRALGTLGLISYSLYIWHEPVLLEFSKRGWLFTDPEAFTANAIVLCLISLPIAFASYWVLEYPTGYLRYMFTPEGRLVDYHHPLEESPSTPVHPSPL